MYTQARVYSSYSSRVEREWVVDQWLLVSDGLPGPRRAVDIEAPVRYVSPFLVFYTTVVSPFADLPLWTRKRTRPRPENGIASQTASDIVSRMHTALRAFLFRANEYINVDASSP